MKEDIEKAIEVLKNGGVILYPTDTVWGLGCDATNETAVAKIFEIKGRDKNKSLILLLDEETKLNKYVHDVPSAAWDILEVTDKPITIVYPKGVNLAKSVCSEEDGSVAIRITSNEFCKQLIRKFNKPIVSTSANFSGEPTPVNYREINPDLIAKVDYTVKFRQQENVNATPSSIIKVGAKGEVKVIRK